MNEETQIQPWKPEDAVAALKERIRLEFAQMIPAEQFAEMVRSVIRDFTTKSSRSGGGTGYMTASDFDLVVLAELKEATKLEVTKFLKSPEWVGKWASDGGPGHMAASARIAELLQLHGPSILNNWLGSAMQHVISQMVPYR